MDETTKKCLETFPQWLELLPKHATELCSLLTAESTDDKARPLLAGGLNYLIKSLDLIPDGIEDLGFLDDVFVLRVSASLALRDAPDVRQTDIRGILKRVSEGTDLIRALLGDGDYLKLEAFTRRQALGAARGRSVRDIVRSSAVRADFCRDVRDWSNDYRIPSFSGDESAIIKLRAFLSAKL